MKNTRITARRVLQGGAAFAALGALSIATALPAAADTEYYGWAYASVGNGEGVSVSYDGNNSNSYSGAVGNWLSFSGSSSATVNGDGVTATATVDTARVQLTVGDVEKIVEENLVDPLQDDAEDDSEAAGEETDDTGADDAEGGEEAADEETGDEETGGEETGGGEAETPSEPEPDTPVESTEPDTPVESVEPTEPEHVVLDEDDTELSSGSDEIVLDATLSGVTTTTTQSWDGVVTHTSDYSVSTPDVVTLDDGQEVTVRVDIQAYEGEDEFFDDEYGVNWNDAYTGFAVTFTVDGAEAPFYYVDLAESVASVGTAKVGGDDGNGDGGGDKGDDKPAPKHPDDETEKQPDPEKLENAESLARTGSPIAGLIAAGAAIAAGGGAAAYFARRKKSAADSAAESSES